MISREMQVVLLLNLLLAGVHDSQHNARFQPHPLYVNLSPNRDRIGAI